MSPQLHDDWEKTSRLSSNIYINTYIVAIVLGHHTRTLSVVAVVVAVAASSFDWPLAKVINQCAVESRSKRLIFINILCFNPNSIIYRVYFKNNKSVWYFLYFCVWLQDICWQYETPNGCCGVGDFRVFIDRRGRSPKESHLPETRRFEVSGIVEMENGKWEEMWLRCKMNERQWL